MSPFNLVFDFTLIWVEIHDLPIDWRVDAIVQKIVSFVGSTEEIDRFSLTSDSLRLVRMCVNFDMSKSPVLVLRSHTKIIMYGWILNMGDYQNSLLLLWKNNSSM